jgi:hypothetical protein
MNKMDNPQETLLKELSWLGGIWDGEGTFAIFSTGINKARQYYTPVCQVANTNAFIMKEIIDILDKLSVGFYIDYVEGSQLKNQKEIFRIRIKNIANVKRFIEIILPYVIGKKPVAEIVLRFCNKRLEAMQNSNRTSKFIEYYDDEDKSLIVSSNELNKVGYSKGSSETTREAALYIFVKMLEKRNIKVDDIVQSLEKSKEQTAIS